MKNFFSRRYIKIAVIASVAIVLTAALFAISYYFLDSLISYNEESAVSSDPTEAEEMLERPLDTAEEPVLPDNPYKPDKFFEIDGIRYYEDMAITGRPGIDVSSYQKDIDWMQVKDAGIEFAIIRVGYRGWSSGKLNQDDCFVQHVEGAIEAGLGVGVYFFSQALTPEEAAEEAEYTLRMIEPYDISGPIVYDWEEVEAHDARTNEMNMLMLTTCADAFCRVISDAGHDACVYFNQAYGYEQFNLPSLEAYKFWLAEYNPVPTFLYDFQIWQYTNEGTVPGIDGNVDLNIMFTRK